LYLLGALRDRKVIRAHRRGGWLSSRCRYLRNIAAFVSFGVWVSIDIIAAIVKHLRGEDNDGEEEDEV
jgi:hypothetical protein